MKLKERKSFALAVALGSFALIGGTGLTVSSAWLITMASQHPPVLVLSVAIVMVRFFGIFRSVARYGERVVSHEAIFKKLTGIRVQLFSAIASQLRAHSRDTAVQSKMMIDDVERAQEFHLRVSLPGISAHVAGLVTILLALWIDSTVVIWFGLTTSIFAIAIPYFVRNYLDPIASQIEEAENHLANEILVASHALVEAEVFGYADHYRAMLQQATLNLRQLEVKSYRRTSIAQFLAISGIGIALIGVSSTLHSESNSLPIHIAMAIFLVLVGFEGYTTWFPNLFPAGKNRRALRSVESLAKRELAVAHQGATPAGCEIVAKQLLPYWEREFLQPVDFVLSPGEVLLITGASGTGKSTLAASLMGFAPYRGSITVGGVELRSIEQLSHYVTGTLQQGYIFNTTVRENLKIADPEASDGALVKVLAAVELSAFSLDEVLGDFGRALSGGEAKRLSIARVLLSSAPIVILDEPLEHLDHERALRVQESIANLTVGKSLIVITHSPWLQYSRKLELARE